MQWTHLSLRSLTTGGKARVGRAGFSPRQPDGCLRISAFSDAPGRHSSHSQRRLLVLLSMLSLELHTIDNTAGIR